VGSSSYRRGVIPESLDHFWDERRVAILATTRRDGTVHQVPVRCVRDGSRFLVLTDSRSVKARNVTHTGRASLAEETSTRWVTIEGPAHLRVDPDLVAQARALYATRHQGTGSFGDCVLVVEVERVLHGS
jgi:F420H(2)-dependent biliverdin reductase